jgi:hypothetical protein
VTIVPNLGHASNPVAVELHCIDIVGRNADEAAVRIEFGNVRFIVTSRFLSGQRKNDMMSLLVMQARKKTAIGSPS